MVFRMKDTEHIYMRGAGTEKSKEQKVMPSCRRGKHTLWGSRNACIEWARSGDPELLFSETQEAWVF